MPKTHSEIVAASVLVVEDELVLASALADGLAAEGFAVEVALDGADGIRRARDRHFDLIVLDLMLPGLEGSRVCQRLRAAGVRTPVLVLTAVYGDRHETAVLEGGADDYLTKPFSFQVLVARLRSLLRRAGRPMTNRLTAGDLVLDEAEHRCWRGRTEIELTPREFALLRCLMRRTGSAVHKREILHEVWEWPFAEESNVVEVYVGYLRRKVDGPFGRRAVRTVRGAGYRIDPTGG